MVDSVRGFESWIDSWIWLVNSGRGFVSRIRLSCIPVVDSVVDLVVDSVVDSVVGLQFSLIN